MEADGEIADNLTMKNGRTISRISGDEVVLPRLFGRAIGVSMLDAARC
jgi:hypothetical protein